MQDQFTKEKAIQIHKSEIWKDMTARQIVEMQLPQRKLCVPWDLFMTSLSECLGRSVYTHEMAGDEGFKRINDEFFNGAPAPTFDEICALIPAEKLIVIEQ